MSKPRDAQLYATVKKRIYKNIPQHSAYRSGTLVSAYRKAYKRKHKSDDAYVGKKKAGGLTQWFAERWTNQNDQVGYSRPGDVYRPTRVVSKSTPTTFPELTRDEVSRAMKEKKKTGRVKRFIRKDARPRQRPRR